MFRTIPRYEEISFGLPYPVMLIDSAEEEIDDATGDIIGVSIPDMEKLVACLAITRALIPQRLDGQEVRFMRLALGMTATAFADALQMDKATFSRWENNKQSLGAWADKQVRLFVVLALSQLASSSKTNPGDLIRLQVIDRQPDQWPHIALKRTAGLGNPQNGPDEWGSMPMAA